MSTQTRLILRAARSRHIKRATKPGWLEKESPRLGRMFQHIVDSCEEQGGPPAGVSNCYEYAMGVVQKERGGRRKKAHHKGQAEWMELFPRLERLLQLLPRIPNYQLPSYSNQVQRIAGELQVQGFHSLASDVHELGIRMGYMSRASTQEDRLHLMAYLGDVKRMFGMVRQRYGRPTRGIQAIRKRNLDLERQALAMRDIAQDVSNLAKAGGSPRDLQRALDYILLRIQKQEYKLPPGSQTQISSAVRKLIEAKRDPSAPGALNLVRQAGAQLGHAMRMMERGKSMKASPANRSEIAGIISAAGGNPRDMMLAMAGAGQIRVSVDQLDQSEAGRMLQRLMSGFKGRGYQVVRAHSGLVSPSNPQNYSAYLVLRLPAGKSAKATKDANGFIAYAERVRREIVGSNNPAAIIIRWSAINQKAAQVDEPAFRQAFLRSKSALNTFNSILAREGETGPKQRGSIRRAALHHIDQMISLARGVDWKSAKGESVTKARLTLGNVELLLRAIYSARRDLKNAQPGGGVIFSRNHVDYIRMAARDTGHQPFIDGAARFEATINRYEDENRPGLQMMVLADPMPVRRSLGMLQDLVENMQAKLRRP